MDYEIYLGKLMSKGELKEVNEFKNAPLVVVSPYIGCDGKIMFMDKRIIIALADQDKDFWHVIIRLTPEEAEKLAKTLLEVVEFSKKTQEKELKQYHKIIT